jgi:translation initiation factor 1
MIGMSSDYDNSMDELLRELRKEETGIVISKDIRKFHKPVTIISGLHDRKDAKNIARQLKSRIGTGGTFKEGQIILQGDHREKAMSLLVAMGFSEDSIEVI